MVLNEDNSSDFKDIFLSPQVAEQWLDSVNNGILVADAETVVRYVNSAYTRITGVPYAQIVGRKLLDIRPGAMLPQIIQSGRSRTGVYRREGDSEYVVDMAPLVLEGTIVGGVSVVKDITEVKKLTEEVRKFAKKTDHLKTMVDRMYKARYTFEDTVGESPQILETVRIAKRAAHGEADILISGESGTGKEVIAQSVHNASNRASGPFVAVNCAAIAPSLIESELFGYEEGSFTGAKKGGRLGLFEMAGGGTIFLDEIGELSLEMQAKLLRVLQERTVRRIGDTSETSIDIRVIAATNKDLYALVQDHKFRADFYYRLNVLNIALPPLRERGWDVVLLAEKFFQAHSRKLGRSLQVDGEVLKLLADYHWPGNVRELRNVVEYAVNMCEDGMVTVLHLPKWFKIGEVLPGSSFSSLAEMVQDFERRRIQTLLAHYGVSIDAKRRAAKELGISLATLYNKLAKK
ncbi:MAG: sigma 54-interacting transcriptional regulator [Negativicutes bacterium]|nr:sigma 54-interacting transcriptional regulator [Negativicutes bacterium]MDR3591763.1 sigma 54-interacting transcriptional regulator [Negativicutes bacterium]